MHKRLLALLAPVSIVAVAPQIATATTSACTPRAGSVITYFKPGFGMYDDGRIVLGGVGSYNGVPSTAGVVLTADGDVDLDLSASLAPRSVSGAQQTDILIEPDGDIVMSGGFTVDDAGGNEVSRMSLPR